MSPDDSKRTIEFITNWYYRIISLIFHFVYLNENEETTLNQIIYQIH